MKTWYLCYIILDIKPFVTEWNLIYFCFKGEQSYQQIEYYDKQKIFIRMHNNNRYKYYEIINHTMSKISLFINCVWNEFPQCGN